MRNWLLPAFGLACMLAACGGRVGAGPILSSGESDDATSQAWAQCIRDADDHMDNGGNIDSVAASVSAQCDAQYEALKAALGEYLDSDARLKFDAEMDSKRLSSAVDIVRQRRQQRAQGQAS